MKIRLTLFAFALSGLVSLTQAQSTATAAAAAHGTSTGGTVNQVPKFLGAKTIVNSAISEVSGKVGIRTTTPSSTLTVSGPIQSTSGGFKFLGHSDSDNLLYVHHPELANLERGQ